VASIYGYEVLVGFGTGAFIQVLSHHPVEFEASFSLNVSILGGLRNHSDSCSTGRYIICHCVSQNLKIDFPQNPERIGRANFGEIEVS